MEEISKAILVGVVTGIMFLLLFTLIMMMVLINYQRRKKKLNDEKKEIEARFQQEILQAQLELQEHIFKTVSQEIHDNVGQILSLAKVNLNILSMEGEQDPRIAEVALLVGKAIRELRDISAGYFGDRLVEDGLVVMIAKELQQLEKTGIFETSFQSDIGHVMIEKTHIIFLYRIFQEICNNIIKHAHATKVDVSLWMVEQKIHMLVKDDGKGFNEADVDFKPGIGLSSIKQRVAMINADVNIKSNKGNGTSILLVFNAA